MQGNPCYARLFADLTRMSPNPIKASGGCGPRTPGGFSTGCGSQKPPPTGGGFCEPLFTCAGGYAAAARRAAAWPGGAGPGPRPFPPSFRLPGPIGRGAWLSAAFWRWWNLQPPGGGGGRARSAQKGWSRRPAAACSSLLFGRPGGPAGPRAAKRRRPPGRLAFCRRPTRTHSLRGSSR